MRNLTFKLIVFIISAFVLYSCSEQKPVKKTEAQYGDTIKSLIDAKQYGPAIVIIDEFSKEYPKSDKLPSVLTQKAALQKEQKDNQGAIKTYQEIAEKFPTAKEAKNALFMVAFTYDETLQDKENAIKSYKIFLEKFPTDADASDNMSQSAARMLEYLQSGKSIDEIIQQNIEKAGTKSKTDSVVTKKPDVKDVQSDPASNGTQDTKTNVTKKPAPSESGKKE